MSNLNAEYPDTCVIKRPTGVVNSQGVEEFDELYNGICEIQYGGSGDTSLKGEFYQSEPLIFIPVYDIMFKINDVVTVSSINNRTVEYSIAQFESLIDFKDTCIWLKGGVE